jgi:hypothetical protein
LNVKAAFSALKTALITIHPSLYLTTGATAVLAASFPPVPCTSQSTHFCIDQKTLVSSFQFAGADLKSLVEFGFIFVVLGSVRIYKTLRASARSAE